MNREWTWGRRVKSGFFSSIYYVYISLVVLWLAFPMLLIIFTSFQGGLHLTWPPKAFTLAAYRQIPPAYWESLRVSVIAGLASTAAAMVIAVPCAWALVRGGLKRSVRSWLTNLVLIPTTLPELVVGIAILRFFRPIGLSGNFQGLVLALTGAMGLALALRYAEGVIQGIDPSLEEAAMTLGANRWTVLRKIVLPLARVGILAASVSIFMTTLMVMLLVYFIAGPFAMPISVKLFTDMGERGILPHSVAMSAILIYIAIGFYIVVSVFLGRRSQSPGLRN